MSLAERMIFSNTIGQTRIDWVQIFTLVATDQISSNRGAVLDENGTQDAQIKNSIHKTTKVYYAMHTKGRKKKETGNKTTPKEYKTIYKPV